MQPGCPLNDFTCSNTARAAASYYALELLLQGTCSFRWPRPEAAAAVR
jgi:hypothetical protein